MFDLLLTLALLYFGYRGYQWYQSVQARVKSGPSQEERVNKRRADEPVDLPKDPDYDEDYIDYEEIKD